MAQHVLVLGPSRSVIPDIIVTGKYRLDLLAQPFNGSLRSDLQNAPRAAASRGQSFSDHVAVRIKAPERGSTKNVYEVKCTVFV